MNRRTFLTAAAATLGPAVRAADPPRDVRITRAVGFDLSIDERKFADEVKVRFDLK